MGKKDEKHEKIKKYTLKMEPLGNYLTFRNRPWKNPKEGSWLQKRTEKGTGEGSYSKTGTEDKTGEGFWL